MPSIVAFLQKYKENRLSWQIYTPGHLVTNVQWLIIVPFIAQSNENYVAQCGCLFARYTNLLAGSRDRKI